MRIRTDDFETKADYDRVALALRQERSELGSERQFKITEYYCVGGADGAYYLKEKKAMLLLRREVRGLSLESDLGWEDINKAFGGGCGNFDVTKEGCQQSTIVVQLVADAHAESGAP